MMRPTFPLLLTCTLLTACGGGGGADPGEQRPTVSYVVYSHQALAAGSLDLYLVKDDGSAAAPLAATPAFEESCATAGGRIIYRSTDNNINKTTLYSVLPDGTDPQPLSAPAEQINCYDITTTDGRLFYESFDGGDFDVHSVWPDGRDRRTLLDSPDTESFEAMAPNGRIVIRQYTGATKDDLWVINGDGSGAVKLAGSADNDIYVGITGNQVIYVRDDTMYERDLLIVGLDGSAAVTLAGHTDREDAALNRDGTIAVHDGRLYFHRSGATDDLYSVALDGSDERAIASTADNESFLSKTGDRILFYRDDGTQGDIYSVGSNGGTALKLTDTTETDNYLGISSSGRLVYAHAVGSNTGIYSVNLDGTGRVTLYDGTLPANFKRLVGDRIIFERRVAGLWDIVSINADGSGQVPIGSDTESDSVVHISPEGYVIYSRHVGGTHYDLFGIDVDGTGEARLTDTADFEEFKTITPSGRIIFQRRVGNTQYDLYSVKPDGSGTTPLATATDADERFERSF